MEAIITADTLQKPTTYPTLPYKNKMSMKI